MKHPKKPTEAQTKKACKDYLRAKKILYLQIQTMRPVTSPKTKQTYFIPIDKELLGAPDLLIPGPGSIAIEIKSDQGRLRDHQINWSKRALEWGIKYFVVKSLEDLEKALS